MNLTYKLPLDNNCKLCHTAIMKLRKPRVTPEQKAKAMTDYSAGMPIEQILERNHMSRKTFYDSLKKEL